MPKFKFYVGPLKDSNLRYSLEVIGFKDSTGKRIKSSIIYSSTSYGNLLSRTRQFLRGRGSNTGRLELAFQGSIPVELEQATREYIDLACHYAELEQRAKQAKILANEATDLL